MLNIKRVADLDASSLSSTSGIWLEITRKCTDHHWQPYKISLSNFMLSLLAKLNELRLEANVQYQHQTLPLGAVFYAALPCESSSFVQANGRFYTTKATNCFYNVTYSSSISSLYRYLYENQDSIASILPIDITDTEVTDQASKRRENNGKYLCDFDQQVIRVPQLNAMYIQSTTVLSELGTYVPASLPNILGMFKACYHLFNKGTDRSSPVWEKLIADLKRMTSGIFDLNVTDVDKNYVETDLDLSNQNEKFDWLSMLGQVIGLNATACSPTYQDIETVNAESIRLIPYICCGTSSVANRKGEGEGEAQS